jgi:HprK-related kinase A
MRFRDLTPQTAAERLSGQGLVLSTGAFRIHLWTDEPGLAHGLTQAYAHHEIELAPALYHVRVGIRRGRWRGPGRDRGVTAFINGEAVLGPFPSYLAYPMLESILNWCIAKQVLRYVVFHAGAVERGGEAMILTGPSGSGKSTLCAALSQTGWRLVSDELILLRPETPQIDTPQSGGPSLVGNPRPISLKNEAIGRIRALAPQAKFSDAYEGTIRGTISFLLPAEAAVARAGEPAKPRHVIFPTFKAGAKGELSELDKAQGFMRLIENSVNYVSTLRTGFEAVADLSEACRFHQLIFGDLDSAFAAIESIAPAKPAQGAAP